MYAAGAVLFVQLQACCKVVTGTASLSILSDSSANTYVLQRRQLPEQLCSQPVTQATTLQGNATERLRVTREPPTATWSVSLGLTSKLSRLMSRRSELCFHLKTKYCVST